MAIKIVLRKRKNADGKQPLILQVWKDGKAATTHLGYYIESKYWDKKNQRVKSSHPNSARLNNFIIKKLADATDGSLELESNKKAFSSKAVIKKIKPGAGSTFFQQSISYLESLKKAGKYNSYTADKPRISHFKQFLGDQDISFTDITTGLLNRYVVWLKSEYKPKGKKIKRLSERTIANHLAVIRCVFAYARENGVIKKEQSPFGEDGIKIEFPETNKVPIDVRDIMNLEEITLADARHEHARKLWLFSFYFAGMRVSDVFRLRWSDFTSSRLHYSMGKNDKSGSLKIPEKAEAILEHYRQFKESPDDFVFPELKGINTDDEFALKRTIAFKTSAIDKLLRLHVAPAAGISKKLTMHITRHTFADLAGDAIPVQQLQKLYRHSDIKTTIGYQANFIHKEADDALDTVIGKTYENKVTKL